MTAADHKSAAGEDRLQRGYRVLRRVIGGSEAPWTGVMISTTAEGSGVLVDAEVLTENWRGWDAAVSGHLLAPVDVLRRADGHDAMLPVCTERVIDLLERRQSGRTPLSPGEGVTVAVSLLRGLAEMETSVSTGQDTPAVVGTWWVTESGRPVFATDTSDDSARDATVELLTKLENGVPALVHALTEAISAAQHRSVARELDRIESALFAVAAPEPITMAVFGPAVFGQSGFGPASAHAAAREINDGPLLEAPTGRRAWATNMARHIDADWADALSHATTGVWRALRKRRPSAGHRRPLLAAMAVAGIIVIAGLMWPFGDDDTATAGGDQHSAVSESPHPEVTAIDPASPVQAVADAAGESSDEIAGPSDLAAIATELLNRRTDCIDDERCLGSVLEYSDSAFTGGAIDLPTPTRTATLVDDLGGLAVLRIDATDASTASQLVVIVHRDDRWLLRDVYDIAQ